MWSRFLRIQRHSYEEVLLLRLYNFPFSLSYVSCELLNGIGCFMFLRYVTSLVTLTYTLYSVSHGLGSPSPPCVEMFWVFYAVRTAKWNWNETITKQFQNCLETVCFVSVLFQRWPAMVVRTLTHMCLFDFHLFSFVIMHLLTRFKHNNIWRYDYITHKIFNTNLQYSSVCFALKFGIII